MKDLQEKALELAANVADEVTYYMDTQYPELMKARSGSARKSLKVVVTQQVIMAVTAAMVAVRRDEREACAKVVEDWQFNDAEDVDGLVAAIRQGRT